MEFTIVTTVILGLLLTPALASDVISEKGSKQITIAGGYQIVTINREWHMATIEEKSTRASWKTIWNYNTVSGKEHAFSGKGFIASKVLPERICFISIRNIKDMPSFDAIPRLAEESRNLKGQGQPAKKIPFVLIKRPVHDLKSYGPDIFAMCRGLTTYMAYEVH
ncbi:PREDICTED: gastrokine-1, partial [Phaethon lepturus]|uniref:gastrokine-1 n=1 Tax=Phaethon lepturus TaxID=97097 RepID=UPI000530A194